MDMDIVRELVTGIIVGMWLAVTVGILIHLLDVLIRKFWP